MVVFVSLPPRLSGPLCMCVRARASCSPGVRDICITSVRIVGGIVSEGGERRMDMFVFVSQGFLSARDESGDHQCLWAHVLGGIDDFKKRAREEMSRYDVLRQQWKISILEW